MDKQKVKAFFKKINPVIRIKMFLDSRIKKAVESLGLRCSWTAVSKRLLKEI